VRVRQGSRAEQGNVCLLQYTKGGTNCGSADALAESVIEWWMEFKGCRQCVLVEGWPASNFGGSTEGRRGVPSFCQSSNLEHASCGTLPAFLRIISNTTRPSSRPKTAHYRSRVLKPLLPEIHENDRLGLV
jgi:hypothetical protein